MLIDDGDTVDGDEQITALEAHPQIEVRIFNPFVYRGHLDLLRDVEFVLSASRLDYRMHNKLFVVDNAIALIGGRNIGDQYFQVDPDSQFADDDVFATGPIVKELSATFDEFWNSARDSGRRACEGKPTDDLNASAGADEHRQQSREAAPTMPLASRPVSRWPE